MSKKIQKWAVPLIAVNAIKHRASARIAAQSIPNFINFLRSIKLPPLDFAYHLRCKTLFHLHLYFL